MNPYSPNTQPRVEVHTGGTAVRRSTFTTKAIVIVALSVVGLLATSVTSHAAASKLQVKVLATGVGGNVNLDDVALLNGNLFVGFQNGVGPMGEPSGSGVTESTIAEYHNEKLIASWSITGKCDGLGADSATGELVATVNEDGNSSLYIINPTTNQAAHYTYSPDPASLGGGGTDAVSFINGTILISGSAPTSASAPAAYTASLDPTTKVATLTPIFADNATATNSTGASVTLALTDPDSNAVVPASSPLYGGDFALNSQGDQEVVFVRGPTSTTPSLTVLPIGAQIDDLTWITSTEGSLIMTDNSTNTIYEISGDFTPGTVFVSTASDSNVPGTVSTLNLATGSLTPVLVGFANPHGLMFIPASH